MLAACGWRALSQPQPSYSLLVCLCVFVSLNGWDHRTVFVVGMKMEGWPSLCVMCCVVLCFVRVLGGLPCTHNGVACLHQLGGIVAGVQGRGVVCINQNNGAVCPDPNSLPCLFLFIRRYDTIYFSIWGQGPSAVSRTPRLAALHPPAHPRTFPPFLAAC